jgi:AbiV family abortive infection protein
MKPKPAVLERTILVTRSNAEALLEDAKSLFDFDRFSTALALAVLAQEEFAKALLLQLVADDAVPWVPAIRRSMSRHECKHLLGIVLEWLPIFEEAYGREDRWAVHHEKWMAWHERRMARIKSGILNNDSDQEPSPPDVPLPAEVTKAINIFRHEQIERLRNGVPRTDGDWANGAARKVAEGSIDKKKQSALYVHVGKTGAVGLHPGQITREESAAAIQLASRFAEGLWQPAEEYRKLLEVLPLIFANLAKGNDDM